MTTATAPTPFPTREALALAATSAADLEREFIRGATPDLADLGGWEFRGINQPAWASVVGIKKFIKGFWWEGGDLYGYNCPVEQNVLDGRWRAKPDDAAPKRFGFYKVERVDPTRRDNLYLHSVLLDYGAGDNGWNPMSGLRDYVVQLGDHLFLGNAYYALGPIRVHSNFFILERHRRGLTDFSRRH